MAFRRSKTNIKTQYSNVFFQREEATDILMDILQKREQTPLLQKIVHAFKRSLSQPHTQNTLVKILTLLNTHLVYPFFGKEEEYRDNFEIANIATNPEKILINAINSVLFSKFITAYYLKHKKEIETSEQMLCKHNATQSTLFTYLTCDAKDKNKGTIFTDVLNIILNAIRKKNTETQKQIYSVLKRISGKKTSLNANDLSTIHLLLKQMLSAA